MKISYTLWLSLLLFSCASTSGLKFADVDISNRNIDGIYENSDQNILKLLDRVGIKDTLHNYNLPAFDKFSIQNLGKKELRISFIRQSDTKIIRNYKFERNGNIYYLKNKNVKFIGIPYLAGAVDERRLYLYVDANNDLKINVIENRSGAVLFIAFLDWNSKHNSYTFKRLEK